MGTVLDSDVSGQLEGIFTEAGIEGFVHVIDIDRGTEFSHGGDTLGHSGSVGKVPVLVTFMRAVADGEYTLDERIRIPTANRTPGPTGLSVLAYETELALRDVAQLMIAVSDNHATDVILDRVGPDRVTATMRELGLSLTTLEIPIAEMYRRAAERAAGVTDPQEQMQLARTDPDLVPETAPWRSTPEELARLFAGIWRDEVAPPELCEEMRTILKSYATTNGLACGFPLPIQMSIGSKTGTTLGVKNEVGVVEYPDGGRYAVGVFTRAPIDRWRLYDAEANAAVGRAACTVVEAVRARAA